jgi:hypothetical protein
MAEKKQRSCGSCGTSITDKNRRKRVNSLCSNCRMPHMSISNLGDGQARCDLCGYIDAYDNLRLLACGNPDIIPCESCGGTPYCAPDCAGIANMLGGPKVYVAGFGTKQ